MKNIKIGHNVDDFALDQEVILTLADTSILENGELNEGPDILVNETMKENYKRELQKENKNKNTYEFNMYNSGEANDKKLLPQYDDIKKEKEGFFLDENMEFNAEKIARLQAIKDKLSGNISKQTNGINLSVNKVIASEYFTPEEDQKNLKIFKKIIKKSQKNQSKELIAFLEENKEDYSQHHGSHETQQSKQRQEELENDYEEKRQRIANFENAIKKAKPEETSRDMLKKRKYDEREEEEDFLNKEIEKQLRLIKREKFEKAEEKIKDLLEKNTTVEKKQRIDQDQVINGLEGVNTSTENPGLINVNNLLEDKSQEQKQEIKSFNVHTDFLKTVVTKQQSIESQQRILAPSAYTVKDAKQGTASIVNVSLPTERILSMKHDQQQLQYKPPKNRKQQIDEFVATPEKIQQEEIENQDEEHQDEEDQDNVEEFDELLDDEEKKKLQKELSFIQEDEVGSGLSGALKLLRERGQLNDIEYSGRAKDKGYLEELEKYGATIDDNIKLEYRDQSGKLMTQKEAFRYICWIFHGKRPGRRKIEHRRKKEQILHHQKTINIHDLPTMKALSKVQEQTNQPYLILSNTSKNK